MSLLGHFQLQFEYECSNTLYFKIELIEKAEQHVLLVWSFLLKNLQTKCAFEILLSYFLI